MAPVAFSMPDSLSTISMFASSSCATTSSYLCPRRLRSLLCVPMSAHWVSMMDSYLRRVFRCFASSSSAALQDLVRSSRSPWPFSIVLRSSSIVEQSSLFSLKYLFCREMWVSSENSS